MTLMTVGHSTTLRRSLMRHMYLCLRARFLHVGRVSGPNSSLNVNMNPARPPHEPVRASVASGTTQTTATTAQSSLLATGLGGGDRTSANFGTFRTATTVATSVAASELYRGDSSSMAQSVSESSYWDNESSAGSQYHPYRKLASCVTGSRARLGTMI